MPGRGRRTHPLQRQDEQGAGDEVNDFDDVLASCELDSIRLRPCGLAGRLVLNIFSMRSVMMKPPTILLVAATIAMTPSTVANVLFFSPTSTIAPTTAIASRAFVRRHQRRVQQRGHMPNDFKTDEGRQHENEQRVDQIGTHANSVPSRIRMTEEQALSTGLCQCRQLKKLSHAGVYNFAAMV